MKHSIYDENTETRFSFGKNITSSYIDWKITDNIKNLFLKYLNSYLPKNNVCIFNFSYFHWLGKEFCSNFEFDFYDYPSFKEQITECIYQERCNYHKKNISSEDEINTVHLLAEKETDNLDYLFKEILEKNSLILNEFKIFISYFNDYVKISLPKEYSQFNRCYNILIDDFEFFKKTKINSLSKYKFTIGVHTEKNFGSRGKTDSFVPSGLCYYGDKIFINSNDDIRNYGSIWFKRNTKQIFYHEIGHALDYLYFNETVLKDGIRRIHCSHNEEFLNICKKNYFKLKQLSSYFSKKQILRLSYYFYPTISVTKEFPFMTETNEEIINHNVDNELFDSFKKSCLELNPLKQKIYSNPKIQEKKFSSIIKKGKFSLDFSRPLEESWAECFAFLFRWMKDGFKEYDQFTLKTHRSYERVFIKLQYDSLVYILNNFDWKKLNFSYSFYLKRKKQIKLFLNHVKNMPLFFHHKSYHVTHSKVYLTYHDLLKKR